jgi:hypothetical protein
LPGKLFAFVNHDPAGNAPTFFTEAAGVAFDSRIPALATDTTSYSFALPPDGGTLRVRARLIYRRSFRALVDAKQWTTDGHGRPLADLTPPHFGHLMEAAERTVLAVACDGRPVGAACADGNACNGDETCDGAGHCVSGSALACDDGDPCSDDACDAASGCVHQANTASCDDGDPCTVGDACAAGSCVGVLTCDDGDPCTDDLCAAAGCLHVPNATPCDDGDACTTGDVCGSGVCTGAGAAACDDGDLCTADACVPVSGCVHAAAPRSDCVPAAMAKLQVRDRAPDGGDRVQWSWRTKALATPEAFGDPSAGATYGLCVFDRVAGTAAVAASLAIPPGARWKARAGGWIYRDRSAASAGVRTVLLAAGPKGARLTLDAKGAAVPMPMPWHPLRFFAEEPAVTVQLVRPDGGCWESTFTPAANHANSGTRFDARLP